MLVLAIDSSGKQGTVALYDKNDGIKIEINLNIKVNHSDTMMISIDSLFRISGYKKEDVDLIAVGVGPGSFTGLRVALATAKALAYSLKKPIVEINSLDAMACSISETEKKILSFFDARKGRVYWAEYKYKNRELLRTTEYKDGEIVEILKKYENEKLVFAGDGSSVYKNMIEEIIGENAYFSKLSYSKIRAAAIAELAIKKEISDNLFTIEPFYISKSQAEQAKEKKMRGAK